MSLTSNNRLVQPLLNSSSYALPLNSLLVTKTSTTKYCSVYACRAVIVSVYQVLMNDALTDVPFIVCLVWIKKAADGTSLEEGRQENRWSMSAFPSAHAKIPASSR